jgi:PTH1 family peptidyl-tRNA hydrolase
MTKLIIGLGNPGEKYKNNRHNVGFLVADRLQSTVYGQYKWEENNKFQAVVCKPSAVDIILAKPQTFMNSSGTAVQKLVNFYKVNMPDLWIIHDDLDIKLGQYKIQQGHGPKLHYGIQSIEKELGTENFWRVRIGVDNRSSEDRIPGEEYVLQNFKEDEIEVRDRVIREVIAELRNEIMNEE